jgi:hypothetical protein
MMRLVRGGTEGTAGETEAVIEEMLYTRLRGATDGCTTGECITDKYITDECTPNECDKEEITLIMAQGPRNEQ